MKQVWESVIILPEWCKMVLDWPMERMLRPHFTSFSHSPTLKDICICHAWLGLAMGQAWGQKSNLATFGEVQWWGQPAPATLRTAFSSCLGDFFCHVLLVQMLVHRIQSAYCKFFKHWHLSRLPFQWKDVPNNCDLQSFLWVAQALICVLYCPFLNSAGPS